MKKAITNIVMQTPDFSDANLRTILEKRALPPDTITELVGQLSTAKKDLEPGTERQSWTPWTDIKEYQPPQSPDELDAEQQNQVDPEEQEEGKGSRNAPRAATRWQRWQRPTQQGKTQVRVGVPPSTRCSGRRDGLKKRKFLSSLL